MRPVAAFVSPRVDERTGSHGRSVAIENDEDDDDHQQEGSDARRTSFA
jgi:hypothetical protein